MRVTLDLDPVVLAALKERQGVERKSLGNLVSELLARALVDSEPISTAPINWPSAPMGARIDLDDRTALHEALDADPEAGHRRRVDDSQRVGDAPS